MAGQENSGASAHRQGLLEAWATRQTTMGGPVFSIGTQRIHTRMLQSVQKSPIRKWPIYVAVDLLPPLTEDTK